MSRPQRSGPTALVTGVSALVSGATGFLGGRLAVALKKQGYRVRALARADQRRRRIWPLTASRS